MSKQTVVLPSLIDLGHFLVSVKSDLDSATSTGATVLALSGDLGAGKTTLVQQLGVLYGITDRMQSPTFGIMKSYPLPSSRFSTLIHMDAYRIEDNSELGPLRFAEVLQDSATLLCIEWAERIESVLPNERLNITLASKPSGERLLTYTNLLRY